MSPPCFWPITYARLDQDIAAPDMQLLPVLQNQVARLERRTCKDKLGIPSRELLLKRCSRESFTWSLQLLMAQSMHTQCFGDASLASPQPITIQTAFRDRPSRGNQKKVNPGLVGTQEHTWWGTWQGQSLLESIHLHGAIENHMAWAPVLWRPAAGIALPLSHSLFLLRCKLNFLLPFDTLFTGFQPSIQNPLPFSPSLQCEQGWGGDRSCWSPGWVPRGCMCGALLRLGRLTSSQFKTRMTVASDFHPGNADFG